MTEFETIHIRCIHKNYVNILVGYTDIFGEAAYIEMNGCSECIKLNEEAQTKRNERRIASWQNKSAI